VVGFGVGGCVGIGRSWVGMGDSGRVKEVAMIRSREEYVLGFTEARMLDDKAGWMIGDLGLECEKDCGPDGLREILEISGLEYTTVRQRIWLARAYPPVTRVTNLSLSHYRAVAAMDDRLEWLARAEEGRWSVKQLREETRSDIQDETGFQDEIAILKQAYSTAVTIKDWLEVRNYADWLQHRAAASALVCQRAIGKILLADGIEPFKKMFKELKVTKRQSDQWQQIADLPDDAFWAYVAGNNASDGDHASAGET
jgi:hypothetical protein